MHEAIYATFVLIFMCLCRPISYDMFKRYKKGTMKRDRYQRIGDGVVAFSEFAVACWALNIIVKFIFQV